LKSKKVSEKRLDFIMKSWKLNDECQQKMYSDAIPKQYQMLFDASCVLIPLFKQKKDLLKPKDLSALNAFASIWCCIENIFLAITAEKYTYALRIYDGIKEMLEILNSKGKRVFIATSKPEVFANQIIQYLQVEKYFEGIVGANLDGTRTDKAEIISILLEHYDIFDRSKVVMVGDREHDIWS